MGFKFILLYIFVCLKTQVFAQNYYYIHPTTGVRERLHWTPTPIGTYATYKTDRDTGIAKKVKYLGDPLTQPSTTIFLPNVGKAVLTQKGMDIQLKFPSGKIKIYESRECWIDSTNKSLIDYVSFRYTPESLSDNIEIYFRGLGLKKEVKCVILMADSKEGSYKVAIPNKEGIYLIHLKEDLIFTHPDGKTQVFIHEYL